MSWFGIPRTKFNPPPEALNIEVTVREVRFDKGDTIVIDIPVERDMVLAKGMTIHVTVKGR